MRMCAMMGVHDAWPIFTKSSPEDHTVSKVCTLVRCLATKLAAWDNAGEHGIDGVPNDWRASVAQD